MGHTPASSHGASTGPLSSIYLTQSGQLDIHAAGAHTVKFDTAADNPLDTNPLTAVPAALGLTIDITGVSGAITLAAVGAWAYEALVFLTSGADITLKAGVGLQSLLSAAPFGIVVAGAEVLQTGVSISGILTGSVGDTTQLRVSTDAAATANPYNVNVALFLVRIA